jgi:hypothetical protein
MKVGRKYHVTFQPRVETYLEKVGFFRSGALNPSKSASVIVRYVGSDGISLELTNEREWDKGGERFDRIRFPEAAIKSVRPCKAGARCR